MRLLICAGGTGGGVYPALAVWEALNQRLDQKSLSVLWIGSIGGMEADLVKRRGIPYMDVPAAGVHGVGWKTLPGNLWQVGRGMIASRRILNSFKPDVLFFTGGYVAVPMAFSARLSRIGRRKPSSLLYVPDVEPGLALKTLANFSDHIALTVEETKKFLPAKVRTTVCGYPIRNELCACADDPSKRQDAYHTFGLSPDIPTLLIFGGSKGARSINRAIISCLPQLLNTCQVIHISGQLDWDEVTEARQKMTAQSSSEMVDRYKVFAYLHEEMGQALAIADLAVSRAGASILGEFPCFGIPAILIPYPYAWRYQFMNASYLEGKDAAIIIKDNEMNQKLLPAIQKILNDPQRLTAMSAAMSRLAKPHAAQSIASLLEDMAGGGAL